MFYNCEYGQVSQKCKKSYCIFKIQKNMYLHVFLDLITSLLKSFELGLYFKNTKKIILFSVSIWDYELIHNTYFLY
jgi:hypothetical protein